MLATDRQCEPQLAEVSAIGLVHVEEETLDSTAFPLKWSCSPHCRQIEVKLVLKFFQTLEKRDRDYKSCIIKLNRTRTTKNGGWVISKDAILDWKYWGRWICREWKMRGTQTGKWREGNWQETVCGKWMEWKLQGMENEGNGVQTVVQKSII